MRLGPKKLMANFLALKTSQLGDSLLDEIGTTSDLEFCNTLSNWRVMVKYTVQTLIRLVFLQIRLDRSAHITCSAGKTLAAS